MDKRKLFILRLIVTVAVLFAIFKFVPYQELVKVYRDSTKIYIFLSFFIFFLPFIIGTLRWRFLLSSLGVKISLRESFYVVFASYFFNLFFPSFVAGDVFRGVSISYRHGKLNHVASSILMDRFSGVVALSSIAFFSFFAGGNLFPQREIFFSIMFLAAIVVGASFVIFSKRFFSLLIRPFKNSSSLKKKIIDFHDHLYFFKKNPQLFIKSLFFSFPIQILTCLGYFVLSKAFGLDVGIIYFLILIPLIMIVAFIPITIAGAGTREAAAVYFFSFIGVEKSISLSLSLLNLVFFVFIGILGGIFYVGVYHRRFQSHL